MSFKVGDYVISKAHTPPSPIWRIWRIDPLRGGGAYALLELVDAQGWGAGPLHDRRISVDRLEEANAMLVLALVSK